MKPVTNENTRVGDVVQALYFERQITFPVKPLILYKWPIPERSEAPMLCYAIQ